MELFNLSHATTSSLTKKKWTQICRSWVTLRKDTKLISKFEIIFHDKLLNHEKIVKVPVSQM